MPLGGYTTYTRNRVNDLVTGKVGSLTGITTGYYELIRASAGQSPRSTAVTLGQTTVPATPNGRMYRCTTAGTTGSSEPTWPTTDGGTVTDGTVTWTEMSPDFLGGTNLTPATYTGYAGRTSATTATLWGSSSAGAAANAATLAWGQNTGGTTQIIGMVVAYDAASAGNALEWFYLNNSGTAYVLTIGTNNTPSVGVGALTSSCT